MKKLGERYKKNWNHILVCLLISVFVLLLTQEFLFELTPLKDLELILLDSHFTRRGQTGFTEGAKVIVVDISEESSKEFLPPYNKWPWPREYFARLIDNLNQAGVKAIGIDVIMSEQDKYDPQNDSLLLNSISKFKNVVVAGKTKIKDERLEAIISEKENFSNIFFRADSSIGLVDVLPDRDGVLRRYLPFFFSFTSNKRIPSFSFSVLNKALGLPNNFVSEHDEKFFNYSNLSIPKFDNSSILINYYGTSNTFPHISFVDVIDDQDFTTVSEKEFDVPINTWDDPSSGLLYSGIFKNKIVLIGSTEPLDKDLFPIPITKQVGGRGGNLMFGVEIHANVIQSVLDQNFLYRQPRFQEIILIIFLVFLSYFITTKIKSVKLKFGILLELSSVLTAVVLIYGILEISYVLFAAQRYVISIVGPVSAVSLGYIGSTVYNFLSERKQKVLIKGMFSQYVNSELVNELIADPKKLQLGGERKVLTVLFSDIASFTTISESHAPEELVNFLNEYLSAMTEVIFNYKGTLDKFEGDAIMAFWGAPIENKDHAHLCCSSAIVMQNKLVGLRNKWKNENKPQIHVRIGINTGEMIVGNMGGKGKFDYTVIGDNVNLGSRLEGANKEYGTSIIISQSTFEQIKNDFICREIDYLLVKGKTRPIRIYELLCPKNHEQQSHFNAMKKPFESGLNLYRGRKFAEAITEFEKVMQVVKDDKPSHIFIQRCKIFLTDPPPENWNGVYEMRTK
jgi:adenylate cyclase